MGVVELEEPGTVGGAQRLVDTQGLRVGGPGALDGEEVPNGGHDQERARREGRGVVGEVETVLQEAGEVLLGVLGPGLEPQLLPGGHVARGDGHRQARLDHRQVGGLGAAAGVPGHRQASGVHVVPGQEIVHSPDRVPGLVAGEVLAGEEALEAGEGVLGGPDPHSRSAQVRVEVERALPLAGRVERQDQEPSLRQGDPRVLVGGVGLAVGRVAGRPQDRRPGRGRGAGHVDVGRHVEAREALVDQLLHPVAVPFQGAGDAGVEGRPVGEAAEPLDEPLADVPLALLDIGSGLESRHRAVPLLEELPGPLGQGGVDHVPEPAHDFERVGGPGSGRGQHQEDGADEWGARAPGASPGRRLVVPAGLGLHRAPPCPGRF